MGHNHRLKPVVHIGPPKTATSSLQVGVIPKLGRPFQIKPKWIHDLARSQAFEPPGQIAKDVIISHESLGDFTAFPPEVIADRLGQVFEDGIIVFVERDPLDLFYSFYRQKLVNTVGIIARLAAKTGESYIPATADQHFDDEFKKVQDSARGFFAMIDFERTRTAFSKRFDVRTIPFNLLHSNPNAFVNAFIDICSGGPKIELPHIKRGEPAVMETALAREGLEAFPITCQSFRDHYRSSMLTSDRADFIRSRHSAAKIETSGQAFGFHQN